MKIAVTATAPSLDADVDPRFGRCLHFLVVETDDLTYEAIENPNVSLGGGAGIQSAQMMADKGVRYVLTGNCGPNAYRTLSAGGIKVIVGCSGSVREVIENLRSGAYSAADQPSVAGHSGTGGGFGRGMGMGRGMGRGGAMGAPPGAPAPSGGPAAGRPASQEDELAGLKQEADTLSRQMQQIHDRIRQLEKKGNSTMTAKVDVDKCTGCGVCVDACPVEAISIEDGLAMVEEEACTGCGACVDECPNEAMKLE